jgi:glycosyltransferase involved in cell wall biosynthesis
MKLAILWNFLQAPVIINNWRDGLRSALEIIGKKHTLHWYLAEDCLYVDDDYDFLLFWADSNDLLIKKYKDYKGKKGLCLTTDPHNIENLRNYDVIYCESEPVYDAVRAQGLHAIRAFGTDINFFKPDETREKDIGYFYPATFSLWKLQSKIAYLGKDLLCLGTLQPDGQNEIQACIDNKVSLKVGYFPAKHIRDYYQRSKRVIIPAIHGSERTILEAMACGIEPVVNIDNKAYSYIKEFKVSGLSPREFVIKNYSHKKYAEDLLRGME